MHQFQLHPHRLLFLLLIGSMWFTPLAIADQPAKLSPERIEQLTQNGDRLADQGDYQTALEAYTQAYQGVVSGIRGQDFLLEVRPSIFNREKLGEEMLRMIDQEYTPEELLLMDSSYKVFGLVPPEIDSSALITALLTEEIAGFYDPDNKRMVLIVEDGPAEEPGWLGKLFGAKSKFDKDEQKTTLAHELTHALQDQLYNLNAMEAGIEDDDDMLLAFSALVEGDATLLMFAEAGDERDITRMDPAAMRATFNLMSWMMPLAGGKTYRTAPPIFRDSLTFPYFQGMLFTLAVASENGWQSVHEAFQNPPLSTEQILHPAKYTTDIDLPQQVLLPDGIQSLLKDWQHLGGNCLGELQTGILLRKVVGGRAAALGWDGDRYEVYQGANQALAMVYVSVWDSEQDAREFATAYRSYREQTSAQSTAVSGGTEPQERPPAPSGGTARPGPAASVFANDAEREVLMHGDQVWIVEGFDTTTTAAIVAKLPDCKFVEKSFPVPTR